MRKVEKFNQDLETLSILSFFKLYMDNVVDDFHAAFKCLHLKISFHYVCTDKIQQSCLAEHLFSDFTILVAE